MRIIRSRFLVALGLLGVTVLINTSVLANTHEGSTCWPTTDCDDIMPAVMEINGAMRCVRILCVGGANNFNYCQYIPTALSPCVTSGSANVNCGVDCTYYDCGPATGGICPSTCDTSVPPTPVGGTLTILKTCT